MTNATDALRALIPELREVLSNVLTELSATGRFSMRIQHCIDALAIAERLATPSGSASGEAIVDASTLRLLLDQSLATIKMQGDFIAALGNEMRAAGCSVDDTPKVVNVRAEAAESEAARLREDAARYWWLRDLPACSFSLSFNDHRVMYESAKQTMENHAGDPKADYFGDVPADERARMIEADTIWTLRVYPHTPVGFNVYHGSTLDAAIDAAMGSANGQG